MDTLLCMLFLVWTGLLDVATLWKTALASSIPNNRIRVCKQAGRQAFPLPNCVYFRPGYAKCLVPCRLATSLILEKVDEINQSMVKGP
jgi:hypothetical protein